MGIKMKNIVLFLITGLVLNACNFKSVDKQNHEAAKTAEFVTAVKDDAVDIKSDPNWLKEIYDLMTQKDYGSVIRKSSDLLGNAKTFQELNTEKVKEGTALLGYYNFSLLENLKAGSNKNGFENYLSWALKGCDKNLQGCESISFLKRDSKSVSVITEILKQKKDSLKITEYYSLIQLGFEVNNQIRTKELEMFYIVKGKEYYDYLDKAGVGERDNKERHTHLFQLILSQNKIDKSDPKMVDWLKQLNPWKYSRYDQSYTVLGSFKIFEVAAKSFIYDDKKLSTSLSQVITELKTTKDSLGISFYTSLKEIKADIARGQKEEDLKILNDDEQKKVKLSLIKAQVIKNFKINMETLLADSFYSEYFYLVDRLFRGHIGVDEANLFWEGTNKSEADVTRVIELYSKIELLKMIFKTNTYMGEIFKQKDIPNDRLFEQVVNRSQPITDEWSIFLTRIEKLTIFVKQKIDSKKSAMADTEKSLLSIGRNVKYLATYPNMMVIGDTMIDLQAELTVASFWGIPIKIDPKQVMKIILDGKIEQPWFIFGGDSSSLNKTETIFSYFFGLESGVFDFFALLKNNTTGKAAKLKFFQNAVKRTLSEETTALKKAIETMEDQNTNKDVAFQNTMITCGLVKKGDLDFSMTAPAEDIKKYLLFGNSTNSTIQTLYNLYNSGPIGQYMNFRDGFESLVIQIRSMMEILALKLTSDVDKQALADLNKEMESYEELKRRFYEVAVEQHHKVSGCLNKLVKLEMDRTLQIYEMEASFFGKVYDEAAKIRAATDPKQKKDLLEAAKSSLSLGANDIVADQQYIFSNWSLIKRVIEYSKNLKPAGLFDLPDQTTQDQIDLAMFPPIPFIDFVSKKLYSRDEFISFALRTVLAQSTDRFRWINTMGELTPLFNKMSSVMSLYNLRYDVDTSKTKAKAISVEEVIEEAGNILKFISIGAREEKVLSYLKLRSRDTKDKLVGILFDSPDSEFKGVMDSSFEKWMQGATDMKEATNFYNDMANLEKFVFPIPENVIGIVESKYRRKVEAMNTRIREIFAGLEAIEKSTKVEDYQVRYELNEGTRGLYSPSLIKEGNYRILSKIVVEDARKTLNNFHKVKTGECYLKTTKENCFIKRAKTK